MEEMKVSAFRISSWLSIFQCKAVKEHVTAAVVSFISVATVTTTVADGKWWYRNGKFYHLIRRKLKMLSNLSPICGIQG